MVYEALIYWTRQQWTGVSIATVTQPFVPGRNVWGYKNDINALFAHCGRIMRESWIPHYIIEFPILILYTRPGALHPSHHQNVDINVYDKFVENNIGYCDIPVQQLQVAFYFYFPVGFLLEFNFRCLKSA